MTKIMFLYIFSLYTELLFYINFIDNLNINFKNEFIFHIYCFIFFLMIYFLFPLYKNDKNIYILKFSFIPLFFITIFFKIIVLNIYEEENKKYNQFIVKFEKEFNQGKILVIEQNNNFKIINNIGLKQNNEYSIKNSQIILNEKEILIFNKITNYIENKNTKEIIDLRIIYRDNIERKSGISIFEYFY